MKKYAIVELKGGLGNQIFLISFANYLKQKNFNVLIDTSFYFQNQIYKRNIEIPLNQLPFKSIRFKNNRIFFYLNTWFQEIDDFEKLDTKIFNKFNGYYQNLQLIENFKSKIFELIEVKSTKPASNSAMIHIRRGDYIGLNENLHEKYYQTAICKLLEKNSNISFNIFTDDKKYLPNKSIFKNVNNIYYPDSKPAIYTLRNMINHEHFIVANSSLSIIAATLGYESQSQVLYPKPWWRNLDIKVTNIKKDWIAIENFI